MNIFRKSCIFCLIILFTCLSCSTPADASVLSSEKITVSVGSEQSWTGINGTGNLSYYGCDRNCECIYLTGGTITCRDGVCSRVWRNKNYRYAISSPITSRINYGDIASTLTISKDSKVISTEELYPKAFDNNID